MPNLLDFTGTTVIVTGAATGMGHEAARLLLEAGADVHAIDVAPVEIEVTVAHRCDLSDPAAVDATVAELPSRVDVLMNCAGIPNGTHWSPLQIMQVNFLGLRQLTDALVDRIPSGGSVANIASIAGNTWATHVAELTELLDTTDASEGTAWCEQHEDVVGDGYFFSKEAVQYFTMWRSAQTIRSGVRMNAICPGVTDTKLLVDFRRGIGDEMLDMTVDVGLGRAARPEEMAPALLFLSHPTAASYINGVNLIVDGGFTAAMSTGQVDLAAYLG